MRVLDTPQVSGIPFDFFSFSVMKHCCDARLMFLFFCGCVGVILWNTATVVLKQSDLTPQRWHLIWLQHQLYYCQLSPSTVWVWLHLPSVNADMGFFSFHPTYTSLTRTQTHTHTLTLLSHAEFNTVAVFFCCQLAFYENPFFGVFAAGYSWFRVFAASKSLHAE